MRTATTIRTQLDLAEYKRLIRNHIIQTQEKTIMGTKEKNVDIKAEGSVAAKPNKEHSCIADAQRIFQN
ncbi:MAG: hypothetical protein EZS28_022821 [Streblomastix strix]|uniref:Uncharacterized protein n=1 Tax=Streblomastix strix TaxID=222440 RepID=A0A5J4VGJ3_9EUKA|nr:MAG: hypothetical protein EZS28_022821 [Streblomastix strix]